MEAKEVTEVIRGGEPELVNTKKYGKERQEGGTRWCELGVWLL
jgi:hypothetical protein